MTHLLHVTDNDPSPSWHLELLQETEQRLATGAEKFVSLEEAKSRLADLKQSA